MNRDFLKISDLQPSELEDLIDTAIKMKNGAIPKSFSGRSVVLLFEKPSLRTKLSFFIGAQMLEANPIYFGPEEVGLGQREPVKDVAKVISRMAKMAIVRTFEHRTIEDFSKASTIPVINALSDHEHPCQALADIQTIKEYFGKLKKIKLAFIGDGNNVARSLAYAVGGCGGNFICASPDGYELDKQTLSDATYYAKQNGGSVFQIRSPIEAVKEADIVYTDVWASMGQESESLKRAQAFSDYQVNPALMSNANTNAKFMHDMPAHPGEEISEDMLYHKSSIVFDQAENRLWAQTALMEALGT